MRKPITTSLLFLVWCLTILVTSPSGAAYVICHSSDGHIAVEVAHKAGCDRTESKPDHSSLDTTLSLSSATCTDIPLGHHISNRFDNRLGKRAGAKNTLTPCPFLTPAFPPASGSDANRHKPQENPVYNRSLRLLKTVFLRL